MKGKRIVLVLVIVAVVASVLFLSRSLSRKDSGLQGSGTVEARNIRVGSKIGGRIEKLLVREGDHVEAGQVLMTFDDKELQASLQQSRANAEKAKRGYRPEEIAEARAAALRPKPITNSRKMGTARKTSPPRKPILIVPPQTKPARNSIFSAMKLLPKKIWSPNSSATLPKPPGKWRWRKEKTRSTNSTS